MNNMQSIFAIRLPARAIATVLLFAFSIAVLSGWSSVRAAVGDGELGVFDADVINDPSNPTRVWRTYSSVDNSTIANNWMVSTMLSMSDDNGATFSTLGIINPSFDVASTTQTWLSEVSSLVFDPSDVAASSTKVLYKALLNDNGEVRPHRSWIAMRSADSPQGTWSDEVKLIAGMAYDPNDPENPEPRQPLFSLPAGMQDCVVLTEPSTLEAANGFYFGVNCVNIFDQMKNRLSLLKFVHPTPGVTELQYKGTLLTRADAASVKSKYKNQYPDLNFMVEFGASDLAKASGKTYLITSPVNNTGNYIGCAVFEVTNLETASIKRQKGTPVLLKYLPGEPSFHRGACTYTSQSTGSGIILSQVVPGAAQPFTLVNTGVQLP